MANGFGLLGHLPLNWYCSFFISLLLSREGILIQQFTVITLILSLYCYHVTLSWYSSLLLLLFSYRFFVITWRDPDTTAYCFCFIPNALILSYDGILIQRFTVIALFLSLHCYHLTRSWHNSLQAYWMNKHIKATCIWFSLFEARHK